ncbi:MAG: hypothetical protein M3R36_08735 [Bacteroidota bacterium]|nr:hypothetical protein [Bacteroidota bacterium]
MFVNPITSDDYYRYLWDGKVQNEGFNPFEFAPRDLISSHDNIIYPKLTYPEIKTIYPPLAQILYFLSYKFFGANAYGLKIFYLFFEAGILIFLYKILKLIKVNTNYIFLYALSPLVIFEFFINAHIDIELLFFLSASIYFALKDDSSLSLLFLGLSVMSKLYSLVFLLFYIIYFFKLNSDYKKIIAGLFYFLIPFSLLLFYQNHIIELFYTMQNYMQHWYFNSLIYQIILYINSFIGIENHQLTRLILILFFIASYIIILKSNFTFIQKMYLFSFFYLFFSHTVHMWYITLLVLFLPVCFSYSALFWSCIIGLVNITVYFHLKQNIWEDYIPVLIIEYLLLIALIIYDIKIISTTNSQINKLNSILKK